MTFIASLLLKLSLLGVAVGGVFAGRKYLQMKDDNIVEEVVEFAIKDQVGIDIDLTPSSLEQEDESQMVKDIVDFASSELEKV
jgi:hypothetical protein